jgi:ribosomal protein L16/L10AE
MVARVAPRPGGFLVDRDTPEKLEAAFRKAKATLPTPTRKP